MCSDLTFLWQKLHISFNITNIFRNSFYFVYFTPLPHHWLWRGILKIDFKPNVGDGMVERYLPHRWGHGMFFWFFFTIWFKFLSTIPLLSGLSTPKMVKTTLVKNYVRNNNQSISYSIDTVHLLSTLYLVMRINLGIQEWFLIIFYLVHMHTNQNKA